MYKLGRKIKETKTTSHLYHSAKAKKRGRKSENLEKNREKERKKKENKKERRKKVFMEAISKLISLVFLHIQVSIAKTKLLNLT